jgi:hypothetical protein
MEKDLEIVLAALEGAAPPEGMQARRRGRLLPAL